MLTMDQHFPDAPYISFDEFSAREEVERTAQAGFDSLFIFTKCHWGFCYHPTRRGVQHPALRGRDMVGELVDECLRQGIIPIAYHSIVFDQTMAELHPEWRLRSEGGEEVVWNREGNPLFRANAQPDPLAGAQSWRFREVCINTGYRRFTLDLIEEFAHAYAFDGVFIDIFGVTTACWCESCRGLYSERAIPAHSSERIDVFRRTELWWESWEQFILDIRSTLDAVRPAMSLSINGTLPGRILRHASFPYSEGGEHPFNMDLLRGCRMPDYQAGIGSPMYDPKSTDTLKQQTSTILSHGGRLLYFFGPGRSVNGVIESHWFDYMEPVNRESMRILPLLEGSRTLPSVAVYHHDACASDIESYHHLSWMNLWRGISGVLQVFRRLHIPCDFLPNWRLTADLASQYRLIIVPEITCISDSDRDLLSEYVEAGGVLLVTGATGVRDEHGVDRPERAFDRLLGIRSLGTDHRYDINTVGGYLTVTDESVLPHLSRDHHYIMPGPFESIVCSDARQAAAIAEPLAVETPGSFIGWQPLPPAPHAVHPAVTTITRGRGRAIYCAAPLAQYLSEAIRWPQLILASVASAVRADLGIRIDGPGSQVDLVVHHLRAGSLLVHLVNTTAARPPGVCEHIEGVGISLERTEWAVSSATVEYPGRAELSVARTASCWSIALPALHHHMIVRIDASVA